MDGTGMETEWGCDALSGTHRGWGCERRMRPKSTCPELGSWFCCYLYWEMWGWTCECSSSVLSVVDSLLSEIPLEKVFGGKAACACAAESRLQPSSISSNYVDSRLDWYY